MNYQMKIKDIIDENFQDYKKPSMMIATCKCDWKCCTEQGLDVSICQNSSIAKQKDYEVSIEDLLDRYLNNPITSAIVIGGLEPMLQFQDILQLVNCLRLEKLCNDPIVIYTGYYPSEINKQINELKQYKNIIIKFGRFIPNSEKRYDNVLGITLNSKNQYAERIS